MLVDSNPRVACTQPVFQVCKLGRPAADIFDVRGVGSGSCWHSRAAAVAPRRGSTRFGAEYDLGVKVGWIDLTHELATSSTGRCSTRSFLRCYAISAAIRGAIRHSPGGHHGSDRSVLSTEAGAGRRVDAHANVPLSRNGVQEVAAASPNNLVSSLDAAAEQGLRAA